MKWPAQVATLSNSRYTVRLDESGSGHSDFQGLAITRWMPDAVGSTDGFHIYLRDLDDPFLWSAAYLPAQVMPDRYEVHNNDRTFEFVREDRGIECRTTVCVAGGADVEIRRCRLTNRGAAARRLEVTSYLEWVLGSREGDANHPAFSKLFVETEFCEERHAIIARRRPRSAEEEPLVGFHAVFCEEDAQLIAALQFETDRKAFLGRGRSVRDPQAMRVDAKLGGTTGPVLDPIASLRVAILLEPQKSCEVAFVLGAGHSQEAIDGALTGLRTFDQVREVIDETQTDGLDHSESDTLRRAGITGSDGATMIVHPPHVPSRVVPDGMPRRNYRPASAENRVASAPIRAQQPLLFENGFGGFSQDGREYVIRIAADGDGVQRRPPLPWANVIANEKVGCLVTESGAGYTWAGNSRLNRLTTWHNDPVMDPHSDAVWIRDEDESVFWSPTPGPLAASSDYVVRHGFGYTKFEHECRELKQETTVFVAREEPVKITRLRIENRSGRVRRISIFSYLQWALGGLAAETAGHVSTEYDGKLRTIWAANPDRNHYGHCAAFSTVQCGDGDACEVSYSGDRKAFLGRFGDLQAPAAIVSDAELDCRCGDALDACAAWRLDVELAPGRAFECSFLLGECDDRLAATRSIEKFDTPERVEHELESVIEFWRENLSAINIETPDAEIDLMVNGWLLYQNLSCRIWGRSAYYQPGGAFGFRDQLQDSAAFVHHRPEITRTQILRHASQQFVEGYVLHCWHPDTRYGVRTRFSDDLLWLPYVVVEYVQKTGDEAVLNEELPFITAPVLEGLQQEAYLRPDAAGVSASLYEHCCRALDRGLTRGANGLPLIGCGDWNDGFSRVGRLGRGESVWLGFFIEHILEGFLPICAARDDADRIATYTVYREQLRQALDNAGWDGAWYRRAYFDNGQLIGSTSSDECQIDAIAQAWAVISGRASAERAELAMAAAEERLIDDEAGIIRLLMPPFDRTVNDPGYIKGYLRGIRENGGQYTHGALWMVRAMAELGRGTRAVELLRMLSHVSHASTPEQVGVYQTEPYVVAADVYGEEPHVGRGGWTWYTGSAGWMFRVALESVLGITTDGGRTLVVNPSISSTWPQCRVNYRRPEGNTRYEITILNPEGNQHGVREATCDGTPAEIVNGAARVTLCEDGGTHRIVVWL